MDGNVIFSMEGVEAPTHYSDLAVKTIANKYFSRNVKANETSVRALDHRVTSTLAHEVVRQGLIRPEDEAVYQAELMASTAQQHSSWNSPVWFNQGLHHVYGISKTENDPDSADRWAVDFETGEVRNGHDAYVRPQNSACFIQSVPDNISGILEHGKKEGMLFKYGSGTGSNVSDIRGVNEPLSGGGVSSGVMSFLPIQDKTAGSIKSGGTTRRAAKMVRMDVNHSDIFRFVGWKAEEEQKALQLCKDPKYDRRNQGDLDAEAYKTVEGQNGNNSVGISDAFMEALSNDGEWDLWYRTADKVGEEVEIPLSEYKDDRSLPDRQFILKTTNKRKTVRSTDLWNYIVRAATINAEPGLQFDDTINRWHTCKESGRINASNPCSEYFFIDDSACNLASINLKNFRKLTPSGDDFRTKTPSGAGASMRGNLESRVGGSVSLEQAEGEGSLNYLGVLVDGEDGQKRNVSLEDYVSGFDVSGYLHAVNLNIISQEALVDQSSYPSREIAQNSHDFRPLGLGFGNLGALLMSYGIPYDSDAGRTLAGALTSLMTAQAYKTSALMAKEVGAFNGFEKNKESMLEVMGMHRDASRDIDASNLPKSLEGIVSVANGLWDEVAVLGEQYGFRNSQVTVIAPTGTIGFKMDFDTTGVEPVSVFGAQKGLSGGGTYHIPIPASVGEGLGSLGYSPEEVTPILEYLNEQNDPKRKERVVATMKGAPGLKEEHLSVFETAMDPQNMTSVDGHLYMMASVTPFLSGAISKTVNLPRGSKLEDIDRTYRKAHELGLKSVALYVDGCKGVQPIFTGSGNNDLVLDRGVKDKPGGGKPIESFRVPIKIGETSVLIEFGEHPNRRPSEAIGDYVVMFGKSGSPHAGETTEWAKAASRSRQYGESVEDFIENNRGSTGTIKGFTNHPYIKSVSSIHDAAAKLAELHYLGVTEGWEVDPTPLEMEELRFNVLAQRNRNTHFSSRIKRIRSMMAEGKEREIIPLLEDNGSNGNGRKKNGGLPPCLSCGHPTILSGATCVKCCNCGSSPGCG